MTLSFKEFIQVKEHAMYQMNTSKFPVVFNKDDVLFLQQFPPEYWVEALKWRYEEGVMKISEAWHEQIGHKLRNPAEMDEDELAKLYANFEYPETEDVTLKIWNKAKRDKVAQTVEVKNVKTGLKKLYWDLQTEKGTTDLDLTDPIRARNPDTGEPIDQMDPRHQFNVTTRTLSDQIARMNLNTWAKCMELGLLGEVPKEWNGKPVQSYTLQKDEKGKDKGATSFARRSGRGGVQKHFRLPTVPVGMEYTVTTYREDKPPVPETKKGVRNVPILLDGVIFGKQQDDKFIAPFRTNKNNFILEMFGLEGEKGARKSVISNSLVDETSRFANDPRLGELGGKPRSAENLKAFIRQQRGPLGLGDEYIRKLDSLIDDAAKDTQISVRNFIIATNPKFSQDVWRVNLKTRDESRESFSENIENLLNNFDLLSDEHKESLRTNKITPDELVSRFDARDASSHMDRWIGGGWNPQYNERPTDKQKRRMDVFKDEDTVEQARRYYERLAIRTINDLMQSGSLNDSDVGVLNTNKDLIVSICVDQLMELSANQITGWLADPAENAKRDPDRKSIIRRTVTSEIRRFKKERGARDSTNVQVQGKEGEGQEIGANVAQSGSAFSAMAQQKGKKWTNASARQQAYTNKQSAAVAEMIKHFQDVLRVYQALIGSVQPRGADSAQAMPGVEQDALGKLRSKVQSVGIFSPASDVWKVSDRQFASIFKALLDKHRRGEAFTTADEVEVEADDYPVGVPETLEDKETEQMAVVDLRKLASFGHLEEFQSAEPGEMQNLDLRKVPAALKDRVIAGVKQYFASKFVPKQLFDEMLPNLVKWMPVNTAAVSPTRPATPPTPPTPPTQQTTARPAAPAAKPATPQSPPMAQQPKPESPKPAAAVAEPKTKDESDQLFRVPHILSLQIENGEDEAALQTIKHSKFPVFLKKAEEALKNHEEHGEDYETMMDTIKDFMDEHGIVIESSLVVGYPDRPNGKYSQRLKDIIRKSGAQAWGAAGMPTGGDSPKPNPIKKSLKEYAEKLKEASEITHFNTRKAELKAKIEARLNADPGSN